MVIIKVDGAKLGNTICCENVGSIVGIMRLRKAWYKFYE